MGFLKIIITSFFCIALSCNKISNVINSPQTHTNFYPLRNQYLIHNKYTKQKLYENSIFEFTFIYIVELDKYLIF